MAPFERVAVVGAGVTGLFVAHELRALCVDRATVYERTGFGAGASGVQPGGIRQQWGTAVNCRLARESLSFYRVAQERLGMRVDPGFRACGYLFLAPGYPIRQRGFIPVGVALAMLLFASAVPSAIEPLVPALQNAPLLTIHVGMAVLSYGIFATACAAGVGYLVQGTTDRVAWLPSHKTLDEVAYRAVIIGFPIFATMIILGSWWASIAWSRYWGWDPKETAALVTWLTYAVYLHARNQRSWAGRPAALLLVVGFGMVLVTYSGSLWFSGLHAYSGL